MPVKLATKWITGLDDDAIKELKQEFVASQPFRKRFIELLNDKVDSNRKKLLSADNYNTPNWDKFVADSIGYERAVKEIISLLSPNEER